MTKEVSVDDFFSAIPGAKEAMEYANTQPRGQFEYHLRPFTERLIAACLVQEILCAGYTIDVYDGEEIVHKNGKECIDILLRFATTDSDTLIVRDKDGLRAGSIWLIWGNGIDLISDHTDNSIIGKFCNDVMNWLDEYL